MSGHAYLRDFTKKVALIGWEFVGLDGNNHPRFHHPATGANYSVPFTPSDWRSEKNALAYMERVAGRQLPRAKAGKLHHRPVAQMSVVRSDREEHCSAALTALVAEARDIRVRFDEVTRSDDRTAAAAARKMLDRYRIIEQECARMHRIIPAITEVSR